MSVDRAIIELDRALRTLLAPASSVRPHPGGLAQEGDLQPAERNHAIGLMRINHSGEICAQALYQGQALTSRDPVIRAALRIAADEETEHLAWTERRIAEMGGRKSLLNPLWYFGSLSFGVLAGRFGDRWSLGFLAETEKQVELHLDEHLRSLPPGDIRSRAIVDQMRQDEIRHAEMAVRHGAAEVPYPARLAMKVTAKIMTKLAYWI